MYKRRVEMNYKQPLCFSLGIHQKNVKNEYIKDSEDDSHLIRE